MAMVFCKIVLEEKLLGFSKFHAMIFFIFFNSPLSASHHTLNLEQESMPCYYRFRHLSSKLISRVQVNIWKIIYWTAQKDIKPWSFSAVQIYTWSFICSLVSSPCTGYNYYEHSQLPVGLITDSVQHWIGIAEVMG